MTPSRVRVRGQQDEPVTFIPQASATRLASTAMPALSSTFDAQDADVVLRAPLEPGSDEFKDFRTHKAILSIASTLFHDMFLVPQPATGDATLPIIPVTESAEVLEVFLRLIYPIEPPAIGPSLPLVYDLFRIAEKYMANGVHMKLKQMLVSPSFLRDDPILVYAIACRMGLDKEAELAIPHTFRIDLIRDIPPTHLQTMTVEPYNRLLMSHEIHRVRLISDFKEVKIPLLKPGVCTCGQRFYTRLRRDIIIGIWERPFLDRERLDLCISNFEGWPKSNCGAESACRVSAKVIFGYFTSILDGIRKHG